MKQFEYLENPELEKEYFPAKWVGNPEYTPITRLDMTSGGGVGGRHWYEYVTRLTPNALPSNQIISVTRYDGKVIYINTSFVVMAENFTLAKASLDVSGGTGEDIKEYFVLIDTGKELRLK